MNTEKLNILVIDDDEIDRIALKRSIRSSGFIAEIVAASNQQEGLDALKAMHFDCIFLDYNLPDCNGIEFLKAHKNQIDGAPVIVVTSHGDEKLAVEAMRSGACDYIPKNLINPEGIAQSIRYAMRLNEAEKNTRQVKHALLASEKSLEAIIENAPIIVFGINKDGLVNMLKGKCLELIDISPNDLIGKSLWEINSMLGIDLTLLKNIAAGKTLNATVEVRNRHFEITCLPHNNEQSEASGIIGIATDITELKRNEIELKNDLTTAKDMQQVKEQFLANMSHEIRTPIHGIMSLTNLLLKTKIDADQLTFLNAIKKSADNLLVIINDILDLSKIEAQKMTFESTIFSFRELVDTTFELFRAKANEKGITLVRNSDECIPEYIKGDPTRISQIINNLVNNAIKFTGQGSVEISTKLIDSNERCSMIALSVRDTGIGIAHDKLSTIFDMFTQAGDDITRKFGGTGLGLSIAKKLVDLQGGIIKVDSIIDKGTTFTFSLPFDHPEPSELEMHHAKSDEPESRIDAELKILIVEDNDINRLVINKMMKDWGLKIDNAINGVDAINKINENNYDIILMDIEMPEMNGYQCIREIRTNLPSPKNNVAVMAMTAHANKKERDKCIQLGMNDYISKPFDPFDLKQKIAALSNHKDNNSCELEPEFLEPVKIEVTTERITNLDYLRVLAEDNESFFTDFIKLFLTNTPEILTDLNNQLELKNWEGVRQAAHKVKPSLNYLGMKKANLTAAEIEENAKEKVAIEKIPDMVKSLCENCALAFFELENELKSTSIH
jgi:PAS domain S-box-containing protein